MQISIQELQKQWGIARSTVYKHIKKVYLTRLDNGLIDVSEIIRVYGEPSHNTQRDSVETAETDILREKIILLESQLAQAEKREEWLKVQVEKAQETIMAFPQDITSPDQLKGLPGIGDTIMDKYN